MADNEKKPSFVDRLGLSHKRPVVAPSNNAAPNNPPSNSSASSTSNATNNTNNPKINNNPNKVVPSSPPQNRPPAAGQQPVEAQQRPQQAPVPQSASAEQPPRTQSAPANTQTSVPPRRSTSNNYKDIIKRSMLDLIHIVTGFDRGKKAWYIIKVKKEKLSQYRMDVKRDSINLDDYGEILYSGYGESVPDDIMAKVKMEYGAE